MPILIEREPLRGQNVGDIAAESSAAALVSSAFNLDLCGDDAVALETAAHHAGANLAALEQALHGVDGTAVTAPAPQSSHDLVSHIISRYHETHRRELPELVKLARKVETIHAEHAQVPHGLADTLQKLLGEIEVHMKEGRAYPVPGECGGIRTADSIRRSPRCVTIMTSTMDGDRSHDRPLPGARRRMRRSAPN